MARTIEEARPDLVDRVEYDRGNWLDPWLIKVYLVRTATQAQALDVACQVVAPAVSHSRISDVWWEVHYDNTAMGAVKGGPCPPDLPDWTKPPA